MKKYEDIEVPQLTEEQLSKILYTRAHTDGMTGWKKVTEGMSSEEISEMMSIRRKNGALKKRLAKRNME